MENKYDIMFCSEDIHIIEIPTAHWYNSRNICLLFECICIISILAFSVAEFQFDERQIGDNKIVIFWV